MKKVLVYFIIIILCIIIVLLSLKIILMKKSANELADELSERLKTDTNTLLTVSHRDRHILKLTAVINSELKNLREDQIRFERGDAEVKTAVTNISHDLRTPLTAISGYLELLEREEKSPEVSRYLSIIGGRVENMKKLTEELFRYSVVMSSEELKTESLDIRKHLSEALLSFYGSFTERGIEPVIDMPEGEVIRKLDPDALNRIFSNIISNAIKYSDGDFSATLKSDGKIIFTNRAEKLDPIIAGRLFDKFFTVEASRNSTGLGLSIAKHLTIAMGGNITGEYMDEKLIITVDFPER